MRGVVYALTASVALVLGAPSSASAGCYGECNGYHENRYGPPAYERSYREPIHHGSHHGGPRYRTTYYERGEEYLVSYREIPAYRTSYYDDGYNGRYGGDHYERPYRRHYSGYSHDRPRYYGYGNGYGGYGYRGYGGHGGYGYSHPIARVGGGWSQTAPALGYGYSGYGSYPSGSAYAGWGGGCSTAYIPYGWDWARARSC